MQQDSCLVSRAFWELLGALHSDAKNTCVALMHIDLWMWRWLPRLIERDHEAYPGAKFTSVGLYVPIESPYFDLNTEFMAKGSV